MIDDHDFIDTNSLKFATTGAIYGTVATYHEVEREIKPVGGSLLRINSFSVILFVIKCVATV